jgi:hypothetical protein
MNAKSFIVHFVSTIMEYVLGGVSIIRHVVSKSKG